MAKLRTSYREIEAHTPELLKELRDKITSGEIELIEVQREIITESGANPGATVVDR